MMQHLKMAAAVASILFIVSVIYFVAIRGGSVDVPLPWGQSATVQIPEPEQGEGQQAPSQADLDVGEPQPERPEIAAPATEGGVDPWGQRYDALVGVTTPPEVEICGFLRITRGFYRTTPEVVIQSFSNTIITRICSVPRAERVFPQGEVCEATPNWHEGARYRREACYTFTPWANLRP